MTLYALPVDGEPTGLSMWLHDAGGCLNVYLTPAEARQVALALVRSAAEAELHDAAR